MNILYSTNCPKCRVLEKKLTDANIDFIVNNNVEEMLSKGFETAPILSLENGTSLDFSKAIDWIKEQQNGN